MWIVSASRSVRLDLVSGLENSREYSILVCRRGMRHRLSREGRLRTVSAGVMRLTAILSNLLYMGMLNRVLILPHMWMNLTGRFRLFPLCGRASVVNLVLQCVCRYVVFLLTSVITLVLAGRPPNIGMRLSFRF